MTGIAATIRVAIENNYNRALFLIQEFHTKSTVQTKLNINKKDIDLFINRITNGEVKAVKTGEIYGPIQIPDTALFSYIPDLYFTKVIQKC